MRVAVLPVEAIGAPAGEDVRLRSELLGAFELSMPGTAVDPGAVDAAVATASAGQPECTADAACLRGVGRDLGVPHLLGVTVATLARTHVLKARLWHTDDVLAEREVNETVLGERDAVVEVVRSLPLRLLPPPRRHWYAQVWVWAGVAAAGAAVATGAVLLLRDRGPQPDITVPLP